MKAELNKKKLIKGTDAVVPLTCKATGDYITGKMIDNQFYQIKSNGSYFKTPIEPKQGQVYEDIKTNKKYVWEDNSYVEFRDSKDGKDGKSAYQSYVDTTTDNPPKTEAEWVASLNGADGVGFASASSPYTADGTWQITLTNGDTITIDLNHEHPQYPKYELVQSLPASPDSGTLYLIAAE